MKIMHAFGTRACAIKMAPLIRETLRRGHETLIAWSGQHYSPNLYEEVFDDLEIPRPNYDIGARGSSCEIGAKILSEGEKIFRGERPDIVLTHGDTFTCNFFSMAAALNLIPVGHVEAGLRTNSWEPFPEQINTRASDACSALYFAPTEKNRRNLLNEGYPADRIFVTGNTVVDAALQHSELARRKSRILEKFEFRKPLVFWSCHRKENLISRERMQGIFDSILEMEDVQFFCSVLPSTQQAAERYGYAERLEKAEHIIWSPCLPKYTDSLRILLESDLCLTDSGGMQEECTCLHIPCLTLRYVTDRPESVEVGANICVGCKKENIMEWTRRVIEDERLRKKMKSAENPYGDGRASERIIDIIEKFEGKLERWENEVKNVSKLVRKGVKL
ncbi:MAG: UDP-N-acetylglucosamine 2-epimerase (non-hydrolyzing) [Candidatus Micrarchaeia archaeon]